nr:glycosyltransferase family 2 protein [uncultured Roseateles sp.]
MSAEQSQAPRVYIVLVNWKGATDTVECLETVFRLNQPNFEVVVCDNDSGDGSVERIMAWAAGEGAEVQAQNPALAHLLTPNIPKPIPAQLLSREQAETVAAATTSDSQAPRLTVIRTGGNLGFAGGNNIGIRYAQRRGDMAYVWLLNNDTVVEPGALTALTARAKAADDRGMVGSTLVFYHRLDALQAMGGAQLRPARALSAPLGFMAAPDTVREIDVAAIESRMSYVIGASMLVSARFLREVGLMCEDYFLYFEELDWAMRGKALGHGCFYAPASRVYHKVGASTERNRSGKLTATTRYAYVNRLKFTQRFHRDQLTRVRGRIFLEGIKECVKGNRAEGVFALRLALGSRGSSDV